MTTQFHLAFAVHDLDEARRFYLDVLGCAPGRATASHVDFDMFGHHVVAHLGATGRAAAGEFDGHEVPVPHFGLNLDRATWQALAERLARSRCRFREYPHTRLAGQVGEHDTLFVYDPSGNALEFKSFRDPGQVFAIDPAGPAPGYDAAPDRARVLRPRIEAAVHRTRGAVQEELLASGFLDSIAAMELVAAIQDDLGAPLADLQLADLATVTTLVAAVVAALDRAALDRAAPAPRPAAGGAR